MRRLALITAVALPLVACEAEPVSTQSSDNPQVPVSHLLTIEDCKVYRFDDANNWRYVTICPNSVMTGSDRTESCGKSCTRTVSEDIPTVTR